MARGTENELHPDGIHAITPALVQGDDNVVAFPSLLRPWEPNETRAGCVSDVEIAHLVSVALEDALDALGQPNPETCLRQRACEARAGIREMLVALKRARARDERALTEYRRAMVLQNLALELALNLVGSIRRYAKIDEQEISADRA